MTAPNFADKTIWTGDNLDILQLRCGTCNSLKGDRPQEYLMARLEEMRVAAR